MSFPFSFQSMYAPSYDAEQVLQLYKLMQLQNLQQLETSSFNSPTLNQSAIQLNNLQSYPNSSLLLQQIFCNPKTPHIVHPSNEDCSLTFLTTSAARQKVFKKTKTICKSKKKLPTLIDLTISSDEDEKSVITIHSVNSDLPENINNLDSTQSTAENSDSTQTSLHSRRSASPEKQPQQPQEILNDMTVVDPLSQINFTVKNIQARRQKKAQRLNCIRIGSFYQAKIPEFQNVLCINNSELKQSDLKIDQQILWDPSKISDTNLENYLQHAKQYHPTDIKYREEVVLDFLVDQQYNSQSLLQNIQLFQQLLNYYVRIRDSARLTKKIVNKDEDNYNKRYGRF